MDNILKFVYGVRDGLLIELPVPDTGFCRLSEGSFHVGPSALIVLPNGRYDAALAGSCKWVSDPLVGIDCPEWAVKYAVGVSYRECWALLSAKDFKSGEIKPDRGDLEALAVGLIKKAPNLRKNKEFTKISRWAKKALREMNNQEFMAREKARQEFLLGCQELLGIKLYKKDLNELRFIHNGGGLQFLRNVLEKGVFKIPHSKNGFRLIYGEATQGLSYPRMEAVIKFAAKKRGLNPIWGKPRFKERKLFSANIGGEFVNKIPL